MNRRGLLKGILGIGAVSVAGRAAAEPAKDEKYWEAQRHIDELYDELQPLKQEGASIEYDQTLQIHPSNQGPYIEITHAGDDVLLTNPKSGRTLVL
jgi:hypothetical protein